MLDFLRLFGGVALLALASVTALPASNNLLWGASLAATEYGYWLAIVGLLILIPAPTQTRLGRAGALMSLVAIPLLLIPVYRARELGTAVQHDFDARFGSDRRDRSRFAQDPRAEPFVMQELVMPLNVPPIRFEQRPFATYGDQKLTLDIYRPAYIDGTAPVVIVVPPWGWRHGNGDFMALNAYLASRDYVVVSPDYRLAPPWRFPAARDDVLMAIAYVQTHARDLGVDPKRIVLVGRADGGALALLAAYTTGESAIRGVVSLYGPSDLRFEYDHPSSGSLRNTHSLLEAYLGGPPVRADQAYFEASPINFVSATSPPTLLIHGSRDQTIRAEESTRLEERLRQEGVRHMFVELPWATHACDKSFDGPCGQIVLYAVERFLDAVTIAPAAPSPAPAARDKLAKR
jgi:acetyl esterase/lipase